MASSNFLNVKTHVSELKNADKDTASEVRHFYSEFNIST